MRKLHIGITLLGATALVAFFQNCSSGSLPNVDTQASSAATESYADLQLIIGSQTPAPGAKQKVFAVGGKTPYQYSISSGTGCTVDPATGDFVASLTAGVVCQVTVLDARQIKASNTVTVTALTQQAPTITAGSVTFDGPLTQSFVLPAYATLTVEVWGGGGAGGSYNLTGTQGGSSSVTGTNVNVSATGGQGGTSYRMVGNAISGNLTFVNGNGGFGGAGGDATKDTAAENFGQMGSVYGGGQAGGAGGAGSLSNAMGGSPSAAAGLPGGGGAGYCGAGVCSGGGGGGGYAEVTASAAGGPAVGSTLVVTAGAGGSTGASSGAIGNSGAVGRVTIHWQ